MLVPIEIDNGLQLSGTDIEPLTFRGLGLKEEHIEAFLRDNIELLAEEESLLIVGQQVRNRERGRSDLVALDQDGNLVLIEIKRDLEDVKTRKEPFEFQAIRYAANYASMTTVDELVDQVFAPYIERNRARFGEPELTPSELGMRKVTSFLQQQNAAGTFNRKQRIFLAAADFDDETLSACAWLSGNGVDISCFRLSPFKLDDRYLLRIEQILPLATLNRLYVGVADPKARKLAPSDRKRSRAVLPRMEKLFEWGIVQPGDALTIRGTDGSRAVVRDHHEVDYQGERLKFNKWGQKVTGWSSICIYEWAYSERLQMTLDAARREKLQERDGADEDE